MKPRNKLNTKKPSVNLILILAAAALLLAIVEPYLSIGAIVNAQIQNQTSMSNNSGIGNEKTIPKIANMGPGNNSQIIMNDKNIGNSNSTILKGMEKSQLGNIIPGNQGTTFEGQQLANISANSTG